MATREWSLAFALCILSRYGVNGDPRQKPENAAGIVGSSVVLQYQGSSDSAEYVTWHHYSPNSASPITIAVDGKIGPSPNNEFYSISGDANIKEYNLGINLQLVVAGRYRCFEQFGNPVTEALAHVIVLGTSVCSSTMQENITVNEVVTYTCEVTYSSGTINWAPVMSWAGPGDPNPVNQSTDGKVKFSIDVTGTPELNEAIYSARTYFQNYTGTLPEKHADNVPGYNQTHTFPPLVVLYSPRNIGMDNKRESYLPGDIITCSADGNPTVSYRWYNRTADSVFITGAKLTVTTQMDGHVFRCEAFNEIRGVEQTLSKDIELVVSQTSVTTASIIPSTTTIPCVAPTSSCLCSGPSRGVVAGIVIAVLFFLGTLIVSVVILWQIRRGPCKKCKGSKRPQPTNSNSSHGVYETPDNSGMTLQQPEYAQLQLT